jgi:hypothetical protein
MVQLVNQHTSTLRNPTCNLQSSLPNTQIVLVQVQTKPTIKTIPTLPSVLTFLQAKEQYVQHLEQQIATLKALSGQLDASTRKQRSRQPLYINLQVRNSSGAADASAVRYCTADGAMLHKCSAQLTFMSVLQAMRPDPGVRIKDSAFTSQMCSTQLADRHRMPAPPSTPTAQS